MNLGKLNAAQKMADCALQKIKPEDQQRRDELNNIVQRIRDETAQREEARLKTMYHFGVLPVELADTIFRMVLEEYPSRVVLLASVCRGWRTTLLQNPTFWNDLYLGSIRPTRKAKLWVSRCSGQLRGLHLMGSKDEMTLCLQELSKVSLRHLRSLSITGLSMKAVRGALPLLTHAVIAQLHDLNLANMLLCHDVFWVWDPEVMYLRNLSVQGSIFPVDWDTLGQHCTHLRSITFRGPITNSYDNFQVLATLFGRNPHLENLEFMVSGGALVPPPVHHQQEPFANANMAALSHILLGGAMLHIKGFIEHLHLPALQSLEFDRAFIDNALTTVTKNGGAQSLQELKIRKSTVTSAAVIGFFREATHLRLLEVHYSDAANDIAEALAVPPKSTGSEEPQMLCPALAHLDLSHSSGLKAGPIVRIVKNRLLYGSESGVASIQSLKLDDCPDFDSTVLPWLRNQVPLMSCVYMTKKEAARKR